MQPVFLKSNFARKHTSVVAMASSMGLITTRISAQTYGNMWRVTSKGLRWINGEKT
jgi:hypothetical protein